MSLLFIDSFDHYATSDFGEKGWSFFGGNDHTIDQSGGRRGGGCMASAGPTTNDFAEQSFTDSDTVVVGGAVNRTAFPNTDVVHFHIQDSGGTTVAKFITTAAGELEIQSGGQTRTSAVAAYTLNAYTYYEVKYTKGTGANGFFELRKDAVVLLTISNSTETAQASSVEVMEPEFAQTVRLDDFYILNGLGSTNNDYLGDVRIDAHFADANGAAQTFVPNTGASAFTHLDEIIPDDDTTFVEAGNINDRDLYSVDTASLGTVIHGIQQCVLARKTDAGVITVDVITEKPAGSGEKVRDNDTSSDNYKYHLAISELDNDDNTSWDDSKINATEFGFKINNIVT